jgi:hypothetical protein
MFSEDGQWKEFGTVSSEHTLFPFWLFCIIWAVLSYLLMLYLLGEETGVALPLSTSAALAAATGASETTPEDLVPVLPTKTKRRRRVESESESEPEPPKPKSKPRPRPVPEQAQEQAQEQEQELNALKPPVELNAPKPRPGYYRLNKVATARNGAPKYIYVGNELDERSDTDEE